MIEGPGEIPPETPDDRGQSSEMSFESTSHDISHDPVSDATYIPMAPGFSDAVGHAPRMPTEPFGVEHFEPGEPIAEGDTEAVDRYHSTLLGAMARDAFYVDESIAYLSDDYDSMYADQGDIEAVTKQLHLQRNTPQGRIDFILRSDQSLAVTFTATDGIKQYAKYYWDDPALSQEDEDLEPEPFTVIRKDTRDPTISNERIPEPGTVPAADIWETETAVRFEAMRDRLMTEGLGIFDPQVSPAELDYISTQLEAAVPPQATYHDVQKIVTREQFAGNERLSIASRIAVEHFERTTRAFRQYFRKPEANAYGPVAVELAKDNAEIIIESAASMDGDGTPHPYLGIRHTETLHGEQFAKGLEQRNLMPLPHASGTFVDDIFLQADSGGLMTIHTVTVVSDQGVTLHSSTQEFWADSYVESAIRNFLLTGEELSF